MGVEMDRVHMSIPKEAREFYMEEAKRLNLPYTNYMSSILINYMDGIKQKRVETDFAKFLVDYVEDDITAKELLKEIQEFNLD